MADVAIVSTARTPIGKAYRRACGRDDGDVGHGFLLGVWSQSAANFRPSPASSSSSFEGCHQ